MLLADGVYGRFDGSSTPKQASSSGELLVAGVYGRFDGGSTPKQTFSSMARGI